MKVGVLVNPSAGHGHRAGEVIARLEQRWPEAELLALDSDAPFFTRATLLPAPAGGHVTRIQQGARALMNTGADLLVTLGGDGTAAYAAEAAVASGKRTPILGIGLGTANVGPIVTLLAGDELPMLDELIFRPVGAIAVFSGGKRVAAGYNDVVLGNTYLATVNGQPVTADGDALLREGIVRECKPLPSVLTAETVIVKNGRPLPHTLGEAGQIVASTLERDTLDGRAVHGIYCYAPGSPALGALTLSARALVSYEEDDRGFDAFAPEERLLFSEEDEITITHLAPETLAVCDGTPYQITDSTVTLRYMPQEILVAERR